MLKGLKIKEVTSFQEFGISLRFIGTCIPTINPMVTSSGSRVLEQERANASPPLQQKTQNKINSKTNHIWNSAYSNV